MQNVESPGSRKIAESPAPTAIAPGVQLKAERVHDPMRILKYAAIVLAAALMVGLVFPYLINRTDETLYPTQIQRKLPDGPRNEAEKFQREQKERRVALASIETQLIAAANGGATQPVSELIRLHEHLTKLDQRKPPFVIVGYYLDDSMPLWPLYFTGLGWLCVLLAPANPAAPKFPGRAVWTRASFVFVPLLLFYRSPTWWRNISGFGKIDRKVYAYANWSISHGSFVVQELMGVTVSVLLAIVWAQWISFFGQRDGEIRAHRHAHAKLEIDLVRVERLQVTFLHWQVSSLVLGIAFLYSTFFFWTRVAQDGDLRYVPNAVVTHLLWVVTWLIVSAPLFITWHDWTQYRRRLLASVANQTKTPDSHDRLLDVVEKLHPVSFWNLTGSTVVGLASLVLPIAHGLFT